MNKINVKQLLRVSKNIQRVPLAKAEGTIISTLPADNVKVEGRDITIFGSKKDVNLAFAKNDDGFVSSAKPVSTTVRPAKLSADLAFNGKTATIKLDGLTSNVVATLKDQSKDLDLGIINDQDDRLSIKSKDNGLEFDIAVTKQRDEYSYAFDFTMDGSVKPELNGNEFILRDTAGNEVFSINGIHMITENGRISTNIETVLTADGKCTIVANADYIKENILNGDIFIAFNVSGHIVPMITLESFRDGKAAQPSNDMYVFGYKGRQEYMLKATIRAKEIASELISRQSENFETLFTLNFDKSNAKNFCEGFRVYDGEDNNLIKTQNFDEAPESITIDITKKVKAAIEAVNAGKEVKDIVLEFKYSCTPMAASDDEYAGEELADNYVEIYGIYSSNTSNRPYIGSKFVSIGEVKEGTPFIEKKLGRSGKSKINIFEGSLQHGFSLGSIAAKSFRVPFSMFYDSRLLTQKFERPKTVGLPKGWMFNLSQCLIKDRTNANKTKGVKEVLYIDGENNTHVLTEKWFYKDESDKEIVVTKDEVYLGNDQKLKYEDANGVVHDVTYQVDNDDGLTFVSTNSKLNYAKQSDMKIEQSFELVSTDGSQKYPVTKNRNGKVVVTFFKNGNADNGITYKEISPEYTKATLKKFTATKILSIKDVYFKDGKAYEKGLNPITSLTSVEIECELLYKDGKYFVCGIDTLYEAEFAYGTAAVNVTSIDSNDYEIELECFTNVDVASDTDIPDYYENEDITNVNSQIKQCEDYIKDLQSQCDSYSSSIASLNSQLSKQSELNSLNNSASYNQNRATQINEKHIDFGNEDDNEDYVTYSEKARSKSESYQEESYKFQVASIKRQIDEQNAALQKVYEKINDYQVQLNNLYELKESYIEAQKEGVQDYIYDKEGNLLGFDYYGKLVYLSDRYENEISLSYVDDKLVEISSEKQRIVLHYNKENELDYVVDATGRKTKFKCSSNTFVMTKRDEKGEAESTTFTFDSEKRLTNIKDKKGQSFGFTWSNFMVSSVTNKSSVGSISETGVEPKDEEVLSTTLIENTGDYIDVENKEAKTIDIYHLDYEGRLIGQTYRDEDDDSKDTVSVNCYDGDNQLLELSYEVKNLLGEIALQGNNASKIEKMIKLGDGGIDVSRLANREMLALSLDFSGVDPSQTKNNTAELMVDVDGIKNSFKFKKIPHGIIAVPALVKDRTGTITITIVFSKNIKLDTLGKIGIYRADATINEYDEEDHVVSSTTRDADTKFNDFDGDNPTSCVTTDRYGVTKTSRALFDASGRPIYEEDGDGNCKETYYDEKGNAIETKEYNKANSSLAKVSRTKYDEEGNATEFEGVMRDKNGNYPQEKAIYLPGTDVVSSIKHPSGQVMVYGYDFNTGLMTEMASDANGQDNATQYGYVANYLVSLAHHGVKLSYVLDNKGRKISTKLNGAELAVSKYEDNYSDGTVTNGQKVTTTFADGFKSVTITDKDGDLISTTTNDGDSIVYEYDDRDRLVKVDRNSGEETVTTAYNAEDQIVSNEYKVDGMTTREDITYDDHGRVAAKTETDGSVVTTTAFEYAEGKEDQIKAASIGDTKHRFEYDALGRVTRKELLDGERPLVDESIEYLRYGENSLDLVKEHDVRIGDAISTTEYEYDVSGNITSIKRDEYETRYQYDELGRLVREDNPVLDKTVVYKYDAGGNILLKKEYKYSLEDRLYSPTITSYTYASKGNKDQLINFNGEKISYDVMGRPTTIGDHKLAWNKKGKLIGYDDIAYTYGLNGIRTSKTVDGVKTTYSLLNNKILAEKSDGKEIIYRYSSDKLIGFAFNGVEYIYERNIQGDVLRIYRKDSLSLVAEYHYDAYGNHEVINHTDEKIGDVNPFRYRGYYFDVETGWYYLNTRYYSSAMGRFISPDELSILDETKSQINGLNLYMYCGDNPVMNVDPSGNFFLTALLIGVIAGAAIGFTTQVVNDYKDDGQVFNGSVSIGDYFGGTLCGALLGGTIGAIVGIGGAGLISSGLTSVGNKFISDLFAYSISGAPMGTIEEYAVAFITGGIGKMFAKPFIDIVINPLLTQISKMAFGHQDNFNGEKLFYDILTRGLTYTMPLQWKPFGRGTSKVIWFSLNN